MGRLTPREVEAAVTEAILDDGKDFLGFLDDSHGSDPGIWWDEETFEPFEDNLEDDEDEDEDDYYDPEWDEYMSDGQDDIPE